MKKFISSLAVFVAVMTIASPASAATFNQVSRSNGTSVFGSWVSQSGKIITYTDIDATKTNTGTDVYVSICTENIYKANSYSCKSGYTVAPSSALIVNKLNTAVLSTVSLDLYDWYGENSETVTVSANFTGYGSTYTSRDVYKYSNSGYSFSTRGKSSYRSATASATLNGTTLTGFEYGSFNQFTYMDAVRIKF
jgi:hypothetical protein